MRSQLQQPLTTTMSAHKSAASIAACRSFCKFSRLPWTSLTTYKPHNYAVVATLYMSCLQVSRRDLAASKILSVATTAVPTATALKNAPSRAHCTVTLTEAATPTPTPKSRAEHKRPQFISPHHMHPCRLLSILNIPNTPSQKPLPAPANLAPNKAENKLTCYYTQQQCTCHTTLEQTGPTYCTWPHTHCSYRTSHKSEDSISQSKVTNRDLALVFIMD